MANYDNLKAAIQDVVKTNGNNEITGALLQQSLLAMINALGVGYQYMGIATPSTNPGTPDQNVFYIAWSPGSYSNFGFTVSDNEVVIFSYNGTWSKDVTGMAPAGSVQALKNIIEPINVIGNELLTVSRNLSTDHYVEVTNGRVRTHTGWSCYIIPVTPGKTYSYKPVGTANYNYAIFFYDSAMNPVKAYGADTSLAAIQAINGEAFPSNNQYGYKKLTIPAGVNFVAFNKDLNTTGSPVFFDGVASGPSDALINEINNKKLFAENGITPSERTIINTINGFLTEDSENVFKFPAAAATPSSSYVGYNSRYAVVIAPDCEHDGILGKLTFADVATAAYTLNFAIFKKVYSGGSVSSLTEIRTGTIAVAAGTKVVDFTSMNIEMKRDYLIGFYSGSNVLKNPLKYANDDTNGYPLWTVYSGGTTVYNHKITIDYNYTIVYQTLSVEVEPQNDFENLNVVVMGDSITWLGGDDCNGRQTPSRGWTTYFKEKAQPKSIRSYARSGATWSHTANTVYDITENTGSLSDDNVIYNQINRLIAAVNGSQQVTPDIIIIAAGTNDAWYPDARPDAVSVTPETEFANTDSYITGQAVNTLTSIAAAMRYDIELLKTNFPYAQIIVLTPLQSTAFTLAKCRTVGDIIEGCAGYLSVPSIRQDKKCGLYRATEKTAFFFTYDGTHTSEIGAKNIGYCLFRYISGLIRDVIQ